MACKKSKFDWDRNLNRHIDEFAFNKFKYNEYEAMEVVAKECQIPRERVELNFSIRSAFVKWCFGINDYDEIENAWWLSEDDNGKCCPIWLITENE